MINVVMGSKDEVPMDPKNRSVLFGVCTIPFLSRVSILLTHPVSAVYPNMEMFRGKFMINQLYANPNFRQVRKPKCCLTNNSKAPHSGLKSDSGITVNGINMNFLNNM